MFSEVIFSAQRNKNRHWEAKLAYKLQLAYRFVFGVYFGWCDVLVSVVCCVRNRESIMLEEDKEDECEVYVAENCFFCITWHFIVCCTYIVYCSQLHWPHNLLWMRRVKIMRLFTLMVCIEQPRSFSFFLGTAFGKVLHFRINFLRHGKSILF